MILIHPWWTVCIVGVHWHSSCSCMIRKGVLLHRQKTNPGDISLPVIAHFLACTQQFRFGIQQLWNSLLKTEQNSSWNTVRIREARWGGAWGFPLPFLSERLMFLISHTLVYQIRICPQTCQKLSVPCCASMLWRQSAGNTQFLNTLEWLQSTGCIIKKRKENTCHSFKVFFLFFV